MVIGSKEVKDLYIDQMIKNLVCDETAYNLTNMPAISTWGDAYALLKEELEETEEALNDTKDQLEKVWKLIRANNHEELETRVKILINQSLEVIHEAIHVAAVGKKVIYQLGGEGDGRS